MVAEVAIVADLVDNLYVQKFNRIFTHKTFQLLAILVFLTIILVASTILRPDVFQNLFSKVKTFGLEVYSGELWKEKSQARVFMEDGSLKISFQITADDRKVLQTFNQKIGLKDEYLDGIAVKLDAVTTQKLQDFLPVQLVLQIDSDSIRFQSGLVTGFASSLVSETKEFATESGKLKYVQYSPTEFQLKITEPYPLIKYATSSGQFVLSDKLLQVYPILERVGTIEMSVNGKSLSGEVKLK